MYFTHCNVQITTYYTWIKLFLRVYIISLEVADTIHHASGNVLFTQCNLPIAMQIFQVVIAVKFRKVDLRATRQRWPGLLALKGMHDAT